ncbi:tetratricopeptide repeat-containing sulfotransferase family protein [Rhizorhapis sp. SPR117]|uniref:tetratricopeptide repeat-containing sulfotransferase family protein n=1 Tax=Rhizorhapis sp. SPR117 TaxID=2912611 RepID=UPI001F1AFC43|nr:sulfotransferase [Rhizorhapis sp. SPR117]
MSAALDIATPELAFADSTLRITRYRGFAAQSLERFDDAVAAYEYVVKHAPDDIESWNNLGNARAALQDYEGGILALKRAMELDPQAAPTRVNLASALQSADRNDEAEEVLRRAAQDFPDDAHPLHELYVMMKRDGRHEEALSVLEKAVARDPDNASLQLKLGIESGIVRKTGEAEKAFRRTIALDPRMADAYLGLIIQYEHTNQEAEFAPLIALAESNGLAEGTLAYMRAMEHRRTKRFEEGLADIVRVPASLEPERTAHIRATLLDRLGRTDEAFAAFEEANGLHQTNPTNPLNRAAELRRELSEKIRIVNPEWVNGWNSVNPPPERPDPVFLVGFPRSGTTLLDTILMGHPATVILEEQPPLNLVEKALGGLDGLPKLDAAGIVAARQHYFDEVVKIHPVGEADLLLDKSPLFLHEVPVIQRLFPNARFILALRHPCDVVLSCFMSNFRLNSAMANFLRLEDATEFYDLTFRYWEHCCAIFLVDVRIVFYERLVENVEREVRPLFDWLGLDWYPDVLDHQRTAKNRGLIATASYSQVTEPIYKRAAGRWQQYRAHLEPVIPVLRPWVEKFGYDL